MPNKFNLPFLGYGMGLRPVHYPYIFENNPDIDWFEIISENFMDTDGRPKRSLARIKEKYPVVMHGVSLSIGTTDPLNSEYLKKLKDLADWVEPKWISDHLCWTGVAHKNVHDLLPVPYTEEALKHVVKNIRQVQDYMERPLLLENPSTYLEFKSSEMPEWEFISRMADEADCGLLLDVNNIYVTCYNHRLDPKRYIDSIPTDRVVQIHLAGHENHGKYIIDTHEGNVIDEVWDLYKYTISRFGKTTTMVEWDANIPEFEIVQAEVKKAKEFAERGGASSPESLILRGSVDNHGVTLESVSANATTDLGNDGFLQAQYTESLNTMQESILEKGNVAADKWVKAKPELSQSEQLDIYIDGYKYRLWEVLSEDLPVLRKYLGDEEADRLLYEYIDSTISGNFNIARYIKKLPEFIKVNHDSSLREENRRSNLSDKKWIATPTSSVRNDVDKFVYELALLETDISQIFDMEETQAMNSGDFTSLSPDELLESKFVPRKALKLYQFEYDVNKYYQAVMDEKSPEKPHKQECFLAVYRHEDKIWRLGLEKDEYKLLKLLCDGKNTSEALEIIMEDIDDGKEEEFLHNTQKWFSKWVGNGLFSKLVATASLPEFSS